MFNNDGVSVNSLFKREEEFEAFFRQHFAGLCSFCQYRFDFSLDAAREVAHSAFIKLWEARNNLSANEPAKSYLYKTASNHCLDILRHEKVRERYDAQMRHSPADAAAGFDELDTKELAARIHDAIAALPPQMRKIFELSRYEEMRYAAIADHLGISIKTVETQMSRALAKLRKSLSDYLHLIVLIILARP